MENPYQINEDNVDIVQQEASRSFRMKKRGMSDKNKLLSLKQIIRSKVLETPAEALTILRTNMVREKNGDLLGDSYNIFNRWMNYFVQLLDVHGVNTVRQTAVHTAEPLVTEDKTVLQKLERYKLPGIDQIMAELDHKINA
jgi:O-glycosyl hydrolase